LWVERERDRDRSDDHFSSRGVPMCGCSLLRTPNPFCSLYDFERDCLHVPPRVSCLSSVQELLEIKDKCPMLLGIDLPKGPRAVCVLNF